MNTIKCICMECQTVFQADYCKPLECPACESTEVRPEGAACAHHQLFRHADL